MADDDDDDDDDDDVLVSVLPIPRNSSAIRGLLLSNARKLLCISFNFLFCVRSVDNMASNSILPSNLAI
jgi:hypothetical protein